MFSDNDSEDEAADAQMSKLHREYMLKVDRLKRKTKEQVPNDAETPGTLNISNQSPRQLSPRAAQESEQRAPHLRGLRRSSLPGDTIAELSQEEAAGTFSVISKLQRKTIPRLQDSIPSISGAPQESTIVEDVLVLVSQLGGQNAPKQTENNLTLQQIMPNKNTSIEVSPNSLIDNSY